MIPMVLKKSSASIAQAMEHSDKLGAGAKKRKKLHNKEDKVATVMKEFKRGTLHSGSGEIVTDKKQAMAIAMSEAGLSKGLIKPSDVKMLQKAFHVSNIEELSKAYAMIGKVESKELKACPDAVGDALWQLQQEQASLTNAEVVSRIDTIKTSLAPLPEGDEKAMLMASLDNLKSIKTMDRERAYALKDLVQALMRLLIPPMQKSVKDGILQDLLKAVPKEGVEGGHKSSPKGYPEKKDKYADPNNFKYPLDTEEHVRAAISYLSKPKNSGVYSAEALKTMWHRIKKAAKKFGIELSKDTGK